ncbi:hypothetical protein Q5H92_22370 [Hymenobacter sp. M29]|uniref:DUF4178 domain-containing protein n=1 Tax=Hymenobacter mellowenesis TaxID=3063995 RepID=A0ABT9AJ39_9BACT|nr:hypothetical protein [Hymenobacter sp. M29]MDO7849125.1 hypothetical protein [Hymenobacter sp. M29]
MEGAQDAQAVLSHKVPPVKLRLLLVDTAKARRLMYLSLLVIPLGYPMVWLLGRGSGVAVFICAFICWLGMFFFIRKNWPDRFITAEGHLLSTGKELLLNIGQQRITFPLNAATTVEITYRGFKGEHLTNRITASGIDNFIQFNEGEVYRFEVLTAQAQETLRNEVRRWYHLKVQVKEWRRDGPTFLLHRDLSYEQIQAYKQEFGVGLYG